MADRRLFFTFKHQGKEGAFVKSMLARGWRETRDPGEAAFIFSDSNILHRGRSLDSYSKTAKIFIYPHAAIPNLFWDMPTQDFSRRIDAHFVPASGHADVMRAYGFPYPIEVTGWSLSKLRPFQAKKEVKKILFGPIHPNSNGFLCSLDRSINRRAFEILLRVAALCDAQLVVRHIGEIKDNGIWKAGGVQYIEGRKDLSTQEIDEADLVVSQQTFLYLAIARGVPSLSMGEKYPVRWGPSEDKLESVHSWEKYKEILMYPLDILEAGDPLELIRCATESDETIREWRSRMIGERYSMETIADRVEAYL